MKKLIAISGPAGVGKGTLVQMLTERNEDIVASVSCTTRAPREGEIDGDVASQHLRADIRQGGAEEAR